MSSSDLNPAAGDHPVTSDPDELAAIRRALATSFEHFPYYAMRYGDRAHAFGLSDGAWLITLCGRRRADALAQIRWLGGVLSCRGMPELMLERYLDALAAELPAKRRYGVLRAAAKELRTRRLKRLPDFDALAATLGRDDVPRFGEIVAAAVADEANGHDGSVASVESWAMDASRFDDGWRDAVRGLIATARGAVSAD